MITKNIVKISLFSYLILEAFCLMPCHAHADWLCNEESSLKVGNVISACGVATAADENKARITALDNAAIEFRRICAQSSDCQGRQVTVEPLRTSCEAKNGSIQCYRLIRYTIGAQASPSTSHFAGPIDTPDSFAPFKYEEISGKPKVFKGMKKADVLATFGKPHSITRGYEGELNLFYLGSLCEQPDHCCTITLSEGIVIGYTSINAVYTKELE